MFLPTLHPSNGLTCHVSHRVLGAFIGSFWGGGGQVRISRRGKQFGRSALNSQKASVKLCLPHVVLIFPWRVSAHFACKSLVVRAPSVWSNSGPEGNFFFGLAVKRFCHVERSTQEACCRSAQAMKSQVTIPDVCCCRFRLLTSSLFARHLFVQRSRSWAF